MPAHAPRLAAALALVALVAGRPTPCLAEPGAAVGVPGPVPARLVSLTPAITETLFALGLGDSVVGVSTYCDYPAEAASRPRVGTFSEPVAEVIVALRPDVVLTSPSPGNEGAVRAIERAGVRVAVVRSEGGLAEARAAIAEVAEAVGARARGEALLAAIDARLEAVRAKASRLSRVRVAVVVGREPLVLAGPASYLGELAVLAGGDNVASAIGGRWPRTGMEFLVVAVPEVIVDLSTAMQGGVDPEDLLAAWRAVPTVPAVAARRIVGEAGSLMLRPGPRLGEAAEAMLVALHPAFATAAVMDEGR